MNYTKQTNKKTKNDKSHGKTAKNQLKKPLLKKRT